MTRRVTQVGDADCALACFAMLTGRPLRAITAALKHRRRMWSDDIGGRGGGLHNGVLALEHLGFKYDEDFVRLTFTNGGVIPRDEVEVITYGRRALLTVRSRRGRGWHMVFWDGRKGYDPSPYHRRHKIPILERECIAIYLFNET